MSQTQTSVRCSDHRKYPISIKSIDGVAVISSEIACYRLLFFFQRSLQLLVPPKEITSEFDL